MMRNARWLAIGGIASALVVWSLALVGQGTAADEDKEVRDGIEKLADVMAKKDLATAKAQGQAIANKLDEVAPAMDLLKPRGDGGLGVGPKPGAITPDGIEKKLIDMGKKPMTAAQVTTQADALARMADEVAAVAEVAQHKCPVKKKEGDKDPKDWQTWCQDMRQGGLDLADAAKAKDAAKVKTAVNKLNSTCSNCHAVFRD
jgi:Cytochrome C'